MYATPNPRTRRTPTHVICFSFGSRLESSSQESLCLTKHSSHLAQHVARALVVFSFTQEHSFTFHMHSSPTFYLTIYPTFSDVYFTRRFILHRSIECVFRPLAETHPPTGYEPKDLTQEDNSVLFAKPMFFHRPSMTSTFDSAESIATLLLDRIGMMSKYGICWLHRCTYRREKQVPTDHEFITPFREKLSVKFISLPKKCRETCRNVLT